MAALSAAGSALSSVMPGFLPGPGHDDCDVLPSFRTSSSPRALARDLEPAAAVWIGPRIFSVRGAEILRVERPVLAVGTDVDPALADRAVRRRRPPLHSSTS